MNIKTLLAAGAGALALAAAAAPAQAYVFGYSDGGNNGTVALLTLDGVTVVNSFDTGWYTGAAHTTDNTNYIVAKPGELGGDGYNNWFAFDLSNLTGSFSTATLTIASYDVNETANYNLFDFGGSISSLVAGTGGVAAFNDLGSGTSYGVFGYSASDSYTTRTLALNAAAVADINAALGGNFALGGTLEPTSAAVPEPATWAMMLLGFFGLGGALRARKAAGALA